MNLTGNAATDGPIVAMLQDDFAGGIKQNMQNMADVSDRRASATSRCANSFKGYGRLRGHCWSSSNGTCSTTAC